MKLFPPWHLICSLQALVESGGLKLNVEPRRLWTSSKKNALQDASDLIKSFSGSIRQLNEGISKDTEKLMRYVIR